MKKIFGLLIALSCTTSMAAIPRVAEINWHTDIANVFSRYNHAWAAYQLQATTALYDTGQVVVAAGVPAQTSDLFANYPLQPLARSDRTMQLYGANGTAVTLCATVIPKNAEDLAGIVRGMADANASWGNGCEAASLVGQPPLPGSYQLLKSVTAVAAEQLLEKDAAERAAQQAVANVITFTLPTGKLLDYHAAVNAVSGAEYATLTNTSGAPWSLTVSQVTGPFVASLTACDLVAPTGTCMVGVTFNPTALGKFYGTVSLLTSEGDTLVLRMLGYSP